MTPSGTTVRSMIEYRIRITDDIGHSVDTGTIDDIPYKVVVDALESDASITRITVETPEWRVDVERI